MEVIVIRNILLNPCLKINCLIIHHFVLALYNSNDKTWLKLLQLIRLIITVKELNKNIMT